jgi:hypothetical protein
MNKRVSVKVDWSADKMTRLPSSGSYMTVAKFAEDGNSWPEEAWSVIIEFDPPERSHAPSFQATARFLMPNAPLDRLRAGSSFGLYEGLKKTATVTVL